VIYVNAKKKVIITCPIHGDFEQTPNAHMNGQGCPKCGSYASSVSRLRDSTDFFKTCSDIHKDFYQYNKSIYTGIKHKITITCPIHGDFEQVAESHINEHKCPKCGVSYGGYNETFFELFPSYKQILGYLYFTELYYNDEQFYKLGITKRSPKIRTSNMVPYKIKNILTYAHIPLYDAFILEQQLLQTFKLFKYYPLYQFSGHTECFNLSTSNAKQFRDVIDTIKQNQYFSGHIE
jgi:Zn finger protein HypA/HybF involved in hydrogenase expression